MKIENFWKTLILMTLLALLAAPALLAGEKCCAKGCPTYDKAKEVTLTGTVEKIDEHSCQAGCSGTHVMLKTADGEFEIHLGPSKYLAEKSFAVAKGDSLEIVGARTKVEGKDAVLARELVKGDAHLTLRGPDGAPAWTTDGGKS